MLYLSFNICFFQEKKLKQLEESALTNDGNHSSVESKSKPLIDSILVKPKNDKLEISLETESSFDEDTALSEELELQQKEEELRDTKILTGMCHEQYGRLWQSVGKYDLAVKYLQKALIVSREVLGDYHLQTALLRSDIGQSLLQARFSPYVISSYIKLSLL